MIDWSFHPVGGDGYLVVAVAALVLVTLLAWGSARARTTPGRRWTLAGLRLAVIVLVIAAMLRPAIVYSDKQKQSATLIILIDKSRSMTVHDEANGKSRFEALRETLGSCPHRTEGLCRGVPSCWPTRSTPICTRPTSPAAQSRWAKPPTATKRPLGKRSSRRWTARRASGSWGSCS